jgi:hypothetical protein
VTVLRYTKGDELEPIELTWPQPNGQPYNFTTGWTFIARIGNPAVAAVFQKVGPTGFTGAATFPNLIIDWAAGDLDSVPAGSYHLDVKAHLTATNQDITHTWLFQILDGVLAP